MKAKLQDLIDAMMMQNEFSTAYFNTKTGQADIISEEEEGYADEDFWSDDLPEWLKERAEQVKDIFESGDYLELPGQWEIDEYRMMSDFCGTQTREDVQDQLLRAIQGKGAFRRFKDRALDLGVIESWYDYKQDRYAEIAIGWCEEHGIEFERSDTKSED